MSVDMELSTSTTLQWPEHAIPKAWVDSLFNKMHRKYGMRFIDQWLGIDMDELKRDWAGSLGVLSRDELSLGVMRLDTCAFPPTLPEFLKLCRPELSPLAAYHEAFEQGMRRECGEPDVWSSPAIFWAWMKVGRIAFARIPYEALRTRWEGALKAEMAKNAHEPIPPYRQALPAPGRATLSVERARQLLADFRAGTRQQATVVLTDPKRWARAIIARHERGEQLELVQIKDAQRAMGLL
jgi:hypothetical protein